MNLNRLRIGLRVVAILLLTLAAFAVVLGDLKFYSHEGIVNEKGEYTPIFHTVVCGPWVVGPALGGLILLASSFIIPKSRSNI